MKTSKFRQSSLRHILAITQKIMVEKKRSDKVFEECFRENNILNDNDKDSIVQYVHFLIKNWRLFKEIQCRLSGTDEEKVSDIIAISLVLSGFPVPPGLTHRKIPCHVVEEVYKEVTQQNALLLSVPDWLHETGLNELGDRWLTILRSLNDPASQVLRVNTLKASRDILQTKLRTRNIQTSLHPDASEALILRERTNVFRLPEFRDGLFEMQDVSSQLTGQFSGAEPGMRVIDACAGNGGKTLHLAGLMKNKGKILALDIFSAKLGNLQKRARRAGASIIETREIENSKVIKRLHGSADLVLLDVPCSGLGVLKRNPEIKWFLTPLDLENLKRTQQEILDRYSLMVRPGGRLIYSTCSILPQENSGQVQFFLQNHPEFEFFQDRFISPEEGFDGFYMASMKRIS